jgi:hypothetical protein
MSLKVKMMGFSLLFYPILLWGRQYWYFFILVLFSLFVCLRLFEECFQQRWYRTAACYILVRIAVFSFEHLLLLSPFFAIII